MKIQGTVILIKPHENAKATPRGILIPKTIKTKPKTGTIIDHGPGCKQAMIGDDIYYNSKSASVIEINGEVHHFINERQAFYFVR